MNINKNIGNEIAIKEREINEIDNDVKNGEKLITCAANDNVAIDGKNDLTSKKDCDKDILKVKEYSSREENAQKSEKIFSIKNGIIPHGDTIGKSTNSNCNVENDNIMSNSYNIRNGDNASGVMNPPTGNHYEEKGKGIHAESKECGNFDKDTKDDSVEEKVKNVNTRKMVDSDSRSSGVKPSEEAGGEICGEKNEPNNSVEEETNDNVHDNVHENGNENVGENEEVIDSNEDRIDDTVDSISSFMLEEDINISRRAYRNFHICSIFIHLTLLLMVLLLIGILCHDFSRALLSSKETVMTYFCAVLLGLLCLHICLNLYISVRLLRQHEVSKNLKSVESKIHVIVLVYFSLCAYIYFFEGKNYPMNSTFSFAIILAIIYYFMPIFLYIILRLIFFIVILILIFMKRKSPTPKRILKKLKIMKYIEYRKFCEEKILSANCFYGEMDENNGEGEKGRSNDQATVEEEAVAVVATEEVPAGGFCGNKSGTSDGSSGKAGNYSNENGEDTHKNYSDKNGTAMTDAGGHTMGDMVKDDRYEEGQHICGKRLFNRKEEHSMEGHEKENRVNRHSKDDNTNESANNRKEANRNNVSSPQNDFYNNDNRNSTNVNVQMNETNQETKTGVFKYFQKVLKKKKNVVEKEKNEMYENLENMSVHINIENSDYVCSICCVEYLNDDDICILPCNYLHYYHKECIFTWLKKNNDCPLCRKNIGKL
ncbi:RING zinc finger protein, putative [Plasmodium ovale]|uniref:RING zinc finger protein, putative n=1 Tax=Plasmodium ovale TaxID=36330 RepID=A0A1C3KXQ1_PLAOA|nr:RING zinc finger protein, putative [Plasmodium ovale]